MPLDAALESSESLAEGELLARFLEKGDLPAREELAVRLYKIAFTQAASLASALGLRWGQDDFADFAQDRMLELFRDDAARLRKLRHKTTGGVIYMTVLLSRCRLIDARRSADERDRDLTGSLDVAVGGKDEDLTLHHLLPDFADTPRGQVLFRELILAVRRAREQVVTDEVVGAALDLWCRGYKYRDISVLLNIPMGTVGTHVKRGIADLATHLAKEGFNP